ncbi:hypothetical protein GCM10009107_41890 [Ideonella azotifigens]|uniref:AMP-dependent synthetase/ligase domain-containing protein n=2 Tax=Ideonella azotifigens TaxID=513160 RepID=A0ABN1KAD2_9BURK
MAAPGAVVGLLHQSGPALVLDWLAALAAGFKPLMMQYPTKKQSFQYWSESVSNTMALAEVSLLLVDTHCGGLLENSSVSTLCIPDPGIDHQTAAPIEVIEQFSILQLSSGTTGHRKAMEFTSQNLHKHVHDYNEDLRLMPESDVIVSWLPLYHDMGYVACFVMPLLLKIPVVMMDPMIWVANPVMLFDAIENHHGTICYMPNFGYEIMSKATPRNLPSMKRWVSCSEPVSPETCRKFVAHLNIPETLISPCYAMAENIFAVALGRGISTLKIGATEVISCGPTISGVKIKLVDGEVYVKSPTSLINYVGTSDIRDEDGYYPTGDLGVMQSGQVYITGRKGDLLIQAGKKFMLSDIDLAVNRLDPSIKGRSAAIQIPDPRLGTQKACILVEDSRFFQKSNGKELAEGIKDILGLEQVEVRHVPPRFLTKTSSGKFNRKKCAQHWLQVEQARAQASAENGGDATEELRKTFPSVDWDLPCVEVLDSLSITVLRLIISDANIAFHREWSLNRYVQALGKEGKTRDDDHSQQEFRIVSLADSGVIKSITEAHLEELSRRLGLRVTFEHVCLPPSPIILSDLIFQEYFMPRANSEHFSVINRHLNKLRNASVIVVDDTAELFYPPTQVYTVLSHNFERDAKADLVTTRWQRYPENHHLLPLTIASGCDIPFNHYNNTQSLLSEYLNTPIFRICQIPEFSEFTGDWDYKIETGKETLRGDLSVDPDVFVDHIESLLKRQGQSVRRFPISQRNQLDVVDLAHYCSHYASKESIDKLISTYSRFCIVGKTASAPYIRKKIELENKSYIYAPSYAPEVIGPLKDQFDCALSVGAMGGFKVDVPIAGIMRTGSRWNTLNLSDPNLANLKYSETAGASPPSGSDWFYDFKPERRATLSKVKVARENRNDYTRELKVKRELEKKMRDEAKAVNQLKRAARLAK